MTLAASVLESVVPSLTVTEKVGATSFPSSTNTTSFAANWALLKLVIGVPSAVVSSNWPPLMPDRLKVNAVSSGSVMPKLAPVRVTVWPSDTVSVALSSTGASLIGV